MYGQRSFAPTTARVAPAPRRAPAHLEHRRDALEHGDVRVQLNLAGAVDEQIIVIHVPLELLREPARVVLQQVLHAPHERAVGAQLQLRLHILDAHELADVKGDGVLEVLRGGVQVGDAHRPALGRAVLLHRVAVRRLARARGAHDQLCVLHGDATGGLGYKSKASVQQPLGLLLG